MNLLLLFISDILIKFEVLASSKLIFLFMFVSS